MVSPPPRPPKKERKKQLFHASHLTFLNQNYKKEKKTIVLSDDVKPEILWLTKLPNASESVKYFNYYLASH